MLIKLKKLMLYIIDPREIIPWDCDKFYVADVINAYKNKKFRRFPGDALERTTTNFNIQRIAYFIKCMPFDAIELDVGCPSLGYYEDDFIIDGWHRIYAALVRKEKFINVNISGEIDYAKSIFK